MLTLLDFKAPGLGFRFLFCFIGSIKSVYQKSIIKAEVVCYRKTCCQFSSVLEVYFLLRIKSNIQEKHIKAERRKVRKEFLCSAFLNMQAV
jgi:hypothetical protein